MWQCIRCGLCCSGAVCGQCKHGLSRLVCAAIDIYGIGSVIDNVNLGIGKVTISLWGCSVLIVTLLNLHTATDYLFFDNRLIVSIYIFI